MGGRFTGVESASTSHRALLFPGQGSQDQAMHKLAEEHFPELIAQAKAELGADPFECLHEGTLYLQPAIYCGLLAHWRADGEPQADFAAGHSLGELVALTVAGCMSASEGMRLVLARASAMQRAIEGAEPGGLLAVIGPRPRALGLGEHYGLTLAADNEPEQVVLSGPLAQLETARLAARECGLKAVPLRVPAALHSSAMSSAVTPFRLALETTVLAAPQMVVIANVTATPFRDIVSELALGVISCVRWRESIQALHAAGVRSYREMGRSGVLSAFAERTLATC